MKQLENNITGYSRVMNALNGIQMERPPVGLLLSLYGKKYVNCTLNDYYSIPELYLEGQSNIIANFDLDIVTTPFVGAFEGEVFGSTLKYFENSPPQIKKPAIESHTEIKNLKIPAVDFKSKKYILESARLLASEYKNEKLIVGLTFSNIDTPSLIMGIEGWLDTLLFHKHAAKALLEKTTQYFIEYANTFFSKGIDALVISNMFSNPSIITHKIMNEITLEYLATALSKINGPIIIHHGGANLTDFLHFFTDLPNVIGFVINSTDDLDISRSKIGNKLLLGNIDMKVISNKTPEIIKKHTIEILDNRENDANFIFFSSNADIMLETPEENIKTVCSTLKNYHKIK